MTSARIAGPREWQGTKYPAEWPAIIDPDTHERLLKMFTDPARRKYVVRAQAHLLSGIAACPHCGRGLHYRSHHGNARSDQYACVSGPYGCGHCAIKAELLEEYVTGAVLDALESPRVQEALRGTATWTPPRRAARNCWPKSSVPREYGPPRAAIWPKEQSTGSTGSISGSAPKTTSLKRGANMTGCPGWPLS